jgi:hypothetical protein
VRWDLGKSRPDRICRDSAIHALRDALRVPARSQIARTRADFERFSEMSENRETGWWMMQSDARCSPRLSICQPADTHAAVDTRRLTTGFQSAALIDHNNV